jgi:hypothetical protein
MSDHCFILSIVFDDSIWISVSSIYYSIVYIQQTLLSIIVSSIYYSITGIQALTTISDHRFILSTECVVQIWTSVSAIYYSFVYSQQALITTISTSIYYSIVDIQQALITVSIWIYGVPKCTIVTQNFHYSCQSDRKGVFRRSRVFWDKACMND